MGRLVTDLAATVANADNLPPKEDLPNVSLWDAFLPKSLTGHTHVQKKEDPTVGMRVYREFYNVKKDKDGRKMVVVRKTDGDGSKKSAVMTEDVKKNGNGNGNGNGDKDGNGGNDKGNKGGNRENGKGGGEEKKEDGGPVEQKPADAEWTIEEDEKLKAMKADNKIWKEIVAEMSRSKKALQDRWKHLNAGEGADTGADKKNQGNKKANSGGDNDGDKKDKSGGGNGGDKKENKKDKKVEKPSNGDKKSEQKSAAKAPSKAPSKAGSGEARFTMGEWMTLQEDDLFSFGELQCLSELIMRDERQRWLRVASMFADKTGRRVHPDDIREKFEEIGRMG